MIYMNKITGDLFLFTENCSVGVYYIRLLGKRGYRLVSQSQYKNYSFIGWL